MGQGLELGLGFRVRVKVGIGSASGLGWGHPQPVPLILLGWSHDKGGLYPALSSARTKPAWLPQWRLICCTIPCSWMFVLAAWQSASMAWSHYPPRKTEQRLKPQVVPCKSEPAIDMPQAMGVLAFELIVGRPPFERESRSSTYEAIMYRRPHFPLWISDAAREFITLALVKVCFSVTCRACCLGSLPGILSPPCRTLLPFQINICTHVSVRNSSSSATVSDESGVCCVLQCRRKHCRPLPGPWLGSFQRASMLSIALQVEYPRPG